jgi:hypothetical protein
MTEELIKKYKIGDGVTDSELDQLIEFFTTLEKSLQLMGPHFHHAWKEVFWDSKNCNSYKQARERNY